MPKTTKHLLYSGEVELQYEENPSHKYIVDGKRVWSVTSITGVLDKPALLQWAANQASTSFKDQLEVGKPYTEVEIEQMYNNARYAFRKSSGDAMMIGTLAHEWIEKFVKAGLAKQEIPTLPSDDRLRLPIEGFLAWTKENGVRFVLSEQKIYSRKYKYAGTLDLEGIVDGKRVIMDIKTSSGIYPEMWLQTSAYLFAREEEEAIEYAGVYVCRIGKTDGEIEVAFKPRSEMKKYFRAFRACHTLFDWKMKEDKK